MRDWESTGELLQASDASTSIQLESDGESILTNPSVPCCWSELLERCRFKKAKTNDENEEQEKSWR